MNAPIGVFDSGIGGLTVAKEIMRQIPGESLVYFGDTARVPYGSLSLIHIFRKNRMRLTVKWRQAAEIPAAAQQDLAGR